MHPLPCPPPVYAENLPLAELCTAELLLVATLRLYSIPHRDPEGVHADWREGLRAAGIDELGAPAFGELFRIVIAAPLRALDVRCPRCQYLGEDEARLLKLVSLFQRGNDRHGAAVLGGWLPSAALRAAMVPAMSLAVAFSAGGLGVPQRHGEAAMLHPANPGQADRGLALVQ